MFFILYSFYVCGEAEGAARTQEVQAVPRPAEFLHPDPGSSFCGLTKLPKQLIALAVSSTSAYFPLFPWFLPHNGGTAH